MIDDFKQDAASRMAKTITALKATMAKIRTVGPMQIYLTE
ncbi:MAG: hypothetical protein CM15mP51_20060 [Porticoccaceae bacterium]|nr:MAG: hypothetical protein CM15mP51_20060 [Porticoccaceae bacterium]